MKCEVALMTRTIKIQGAKGSWEDRYGGPLLFIYLNQIKSNKRTHNGDRRSGLWLNWTNKLY